VKIRTTEELVDAIASELSWRRKELTDIRYLVQQAGGNRSRQDLMTRAGVALLYAHWEGFVKAAAEAYLQFVAMQRCKNSELARCMLALMVRTRLNAASASKKISTHLELVDFFRSSMKQRSVLPYKNAIHTESNLSSTVFFEILRTLGFDTEEYESKAHMIDNQLLAKRNHIAHGSVLDVNVDDYLSIYDGITALMSSFRNQLENAAVTKQYLHH
jgi:hypothetical protein